MTKSQAAKLALRLQLRFPQANWGTVDEHGVPALAKAYAADLEDLPLDATVQALRALVRTQESPWPPTVGAIRKAVLERVAGRPRTGEEAWGIVREGIRFFGRDREPKWRDPLIKQALRMFGGWLAVCDSPESSEMSDRMRFAKLYDELAGRQRDERLASPGLLPAAEAPRLAEKSEGDAFALVASLGDQLAAKAAS